jgi:hypothetical protein
MKTRLAPLAAAVALTFTGCADDMGSVQLYEICAFPTDTCTFESTCSLHPLGDFVLDLNLQRQLELVIQVNNQRVPTTDLGTPVDTAAAYAEGWTVTYEAPAPLVVPGTSGRLAATVPPSGSTIVLLEPITAAVGAALVPQVVTSVDLVAKVRLNGQYADQTRFETAEYEIPVRVCKGCLGAGVSCPVGKVLESMCPPGAIGQLPVGLNCK